MEWRGTHLKDIRNCARCGKMMVYTGSPICPECRRREEEEYEKVRAFLTQNPGASISAIEEATGVPAQTILDFFRRGLLELSASSDSALVCAICKRPIEKGRICPECEKNLIRGVKDNRVDVEKGSRAASLGHGPERMYISDTLLKKGK